MTPEASLNPMKRLGQILIIGLLLLGAGRVWAINLVPSGGLADEPTNDVIPVNLGGVRVTEIGSGGSGYSYRWPTASEMSDVNHFDGITFRYPTAQLQNTLNNAVANPSALNAADQTLIQDELARRVRYRNYIGSGQFTPNGLATQWETEHNGSSPGSDGGGAQKVLPNCGLDPFCGLIKAVTWLLQKGVVTIFSWFSMLANQIFNITVNTSVRTFDKIGNSDGVKVAWGTVRDLVNISLIFVLLYVAIGTILNLSSVNGKHLLKNVIIAALLVNFSMFFTGIVIDASNVVANSLYNLAGQGLPLGINGAPDVISPLTQAAEAGYKARLSTAADEAVWANSSSVTGTADKYTILLQIIVAAMGTIILMLITTTVLLAGAILFFIRSIVLVFVIVSAPVAFLAFAVGGPTMGKLSGKWKNGLVSQVIFAPAFMLMIYLTGQVVTAGTASGLIGDTTFAGGIAVFALINGMMLGALVVAKELGVAGAGVANKALGGLKKAGMVAAGGATLGAAGFAARNTLGRLSRGVADSEKLKEAGKQRGLGGFLARTTLRASSGVAGSSFDARAGVIGKTTGLNQLGKGWGKRGYDQTVKNKIEREKKIAELLTPNEEIQAKQAAEQGRIVTDTRENITRLETEARTSKNKLNAQKEELAKEEAKTAPDSGVVANIKADIVRLEAETKTGEGELNVQREELAKEEAKLAAIKKTPGRERQEEYAKQLEEGDFWKTVFSGSTKRNRRKAARAIRTDAKKSPEEKREEKRNKEFSEKIKDLLEKSRKDEEKEAGDTGKEEKTPKEEKTS